MSSNRVNLPCFLLLRKSRAEEDDPDALRRHRQILCDLAAKDGVEISHVCEEVMSGEKLSRRPQFRQLLEIIRGLPDGGGAVLYCMDVDRISRGSLTERGLIQDLLIAKAVRIRTPGGYVNLAVADELLLTEVRGALAHHYLNKFRERVQQTRSLQVRQGKLRGGRVPFGYVWDLRTKGPIPDPVRFPILKAWCHQAFFSSTVALGQQYRVPQETVYRALASPIICGWPAKIRDAQGNLMPRDRWVWPEQAGEYEAAISREDWERLQTVLSSRKNGHGGRMLTRDAWCRSLLRLEGEPSGCHVNLSNVIWEGVRVPTYMWIRIVEGRKLSPGYISRAEVHDVVYEALKGICADADRIVSEIDRGWALEQGQRPDVAALEAKREALRKELVAHQRSMARTGDGEEVEAIRAAVEEVKAELKEVKAAITRAGSSGGGLAKAEIEGMKAIILDFGRFWHGLPDEARAATAEALLSEVRVTLRQGNGPKFEREVCPIPRYNPDG